VLSDAITVRLGLGGLVVLGTHEDDYAVEVVAHYAAAEASCPRCDRTTWQVHQVHRQRKQDASLWAKPVSIVLLKRRFRCLTHGRAVAAPTYIVEAGYFSCAEIWMSTQVLGPGVPAPGGASLQPAPSVLIISRSKPGSGGP